MRAASWATQKRPESLVGLNDQVLFWIQQLSPVGVFLSNAKGACIYSNEYWGRVAGLPPGPIKFENWMDVIHPEDRLSVLAKWAGFLASKDHLENFEFRYLPKGGTTRWVVASGVSIQNEQDGSWNFLRLELDISHQKRAEAVVLRQEMMLAASAKLSALGEMAAGVAHEINNPITIIFGQAEELIDMATQNSLNCGRVASVAAKISDTASRIAKIVKGLKTFSREEVAASFESIDVGAVVAMAVDLCCEKFKSRGISLHLDSIPQNTMIHGNGIQISQVLINLLNNAYDAISGSDEKWIKIGFCDLNEKVVLSVTDSGPGVPVEIREKIFQPFFTTKAPGKGTGLGLSISKSIIESHDGNFFLKEVEGYRVAFIIELKKAADAAAANQRA